MRKEKTQGFGRIAAETAACLLFGGAAMFALVLLGLDVPEGAEIGWRFIALKLAGFGILAAIGLVFRHFDKPHKGTGPVHQGE